jgi:hypothetical protein
MIARIFRPVFTVRRSLVVLGAVVGGLVFPAASMAITAQIKTAPIHKTNQGFLFTLWIKQGGPTGYGARNPNSVSGILFRHNGNATENDNYSFNNTKSHPLKFQPGANPKSLQFAKMTGTFANGRGSINLTFKATGPAHHVSVPKGCTGNAGERRAGRLTGSFTLQADKLGTITQKTFKNATISSASFFCPPKAHGYDVETSIGSPFVDAFKNTSNKVTETIEKSPQGSGWQFIYKYYVTGLPGSDYLVQTPSNLKKATIKGGGGFTGTGATYSSNSTKAKTNHTSGHLSGSLAATLASIGPVKAFSGSPRPALQTHS